MSTMYKMIIPLLHDDITKDDINTEKGFVDVFSKDINKPSLDNCIFLMYKWDTKEESFLRDEKFAKLGIIKHKRLAYINNVCYKIFAISITNPDIKRLLKGLMVSTYKSKSRIIKFWDFSEGDINKIMFTTGCTFNYEQSVLPEEDYMGEDDTEEGLVIPGGIADPFLFYTLSHRLV